MSDLFKGVGVEVDILVPDNFLKIKETLTRIGIPSKDGQKLYQSCHILHKRDTAGNSHYAIVHFKEMFKLDGKTTDISPDDFARRNHITILLEDWKLLKILEDIPDEDLAGVSELKIIPFKEKANWELITKYTIGKKGYNNGKSN